VDRCYHQDSCFELIMNVSRACYNDGTLKDACLVEKVICYISKDIKFTPYSFIGDLFLK